MVMAWHWQLSRNWRRTGAQESASDPIGGQLHQRPYSIETSPEAGRTARRQQHLWQYYNTSERFSQISNQELLDDYAHNNNGKYLISIIQKYLDDVDSGNLLDEGFNQYTEIKPIVGELANQSVAGMVRKRAELKAVCK